MKSSQSKITQPSSSTASETAENPTTETISSYETRSGVLPEQQQRTATPRPSDLLVQTGLDTLFDAWASLVVGQVQITTQAAIRLAQCWFSPALMSGISEVQRRYAEDSIASATAAASRLAQFTPSAINQNQLQSSQNIGAQQRQQGYSSHEYSQRQYG